MRYADFDLRIYREADGRYRAEASCAGKEKDIEVQLSSFEREMEELGRDLRNHSERRGKNLGKRLYEAVFRSLGNLLPAGLPRWYAKRGLRLRLRLDDPTVSGWLWELLHTRGSFLAHSVTTPVVRSLENDDPLPALRTAWPIRVLVVVSSPDGHEQLDGEKEVADIREALGWREALGLVKVERLKPPTLVELDKRLATGRFHVLHFIGHGTFLRDRQQGALLFEDPDKGADRVDGDRLAAVLLGDKSLRLVVLNACDSARVASEDLLSGVAHSLAQQRIPAVVGMQYPIWDESAIAFSRRFYGVLARWRPVDWAMARARQAMCAASDGLDWAIPVLFLSSKDGRIFRWRPSWGLLGAFFTILLMLLGYQRWYSQATPQEPVLTLTSVQPCPPVEGLEMKFVRIPAGSFIMGGTKGNEKPSHKVEISNPFCLSVYEVTQKQWESVMGLNSHKSRYRGDDLPVSGVTWEAVQDFLGKVNQGAGWNVVRLPTEAEWEYAAQGLAAFNCRDDRIPGLAPVRSPGPNPWGLHYMHGNVAEWVQDWYGPYLPGPVTDPQGSPSGEERVKRGGGYDSVPQSCRSTYRSSQKPDSSRYDLGFRVLRELR